MSQREPLRQGMEYSTSIALRIVTFVVGIVAVLWIIRMLLRV